MVYNSIRPGQTWLDTNGNRIQAHGGSIFYQDETFYWYGENKEKTRADNNIWHWGVRCYASKDLYNWEDKGLIIEPEPDDISSPLHPSSCMDRPHIIYNKRTKQYVCWLKIMNAAHMQTETILVADHLLGPYKKVKQGLRPLGMNAGDFDLVVEPSDGKAYYYFERVHSELICADLTDDYTDVSGYYSTHFPRVRTPFVREAPAHFYRKGKHYMFTSGTSGYDPNPSEVAIADTYHGPWNVLGNPHRYDQTLTSYNSQITSVFKHPLKKDLYIALADRWVPNIKEKYGDGYENGDTWRRATAGARRIIDGTFDMSLLKMAKLQEVTYDTSVSEYVWLPVAFDDGIPYIDWKEEWRIEDYE